MADEQYTKSKELMGNGGRDGSAYKSETGGMASGKKADKLSSSAPESKKKGDACYKDYCKSE